jgi:hypothetical protein
LTAVGDDEFEHRQEAFCRQQMSSRNRRQLRARLATDGYEASRIATVRAALLVEGGDELANEFSMEESIFTLPELADVTESTLTVDAVVQTEPVMVLPVPPVCYQAASHAENNDMQDQGVNTDDR